MQPYNYESLQGSGDSIRLLHLKAGNQGGDVVCSLFGAVLSEGPEYEALSYCWGAESELTPILCSDSGVSLYVRPNLLAALRELRLPDKDRVLWIDALCIDQNNVAERNQQVRLMQEIYKEASCVLIWLGLEEDGDKKAIELLEQIAQIVDRTPYSCDSKEILSYLQYRIPLSLSPEWEPVRKLLQRAWFTRMWVIQEAVMARKATVYIGSRKVRFERISTPVELARSLNSIDDSVPGVKSLVLISALKKNQVPMVRLLSATRRLEATDPRDRVFSLSGLTSDYSELGIDIDYSQSVAGIYHQLAVRCLVIRQDMRYLSCTGLIDVEASLGLPSWVPNWTRTNDLRNSQVIISDLCLRASGNEKPHLSIGGNILTISGYYFDSIATPKKTPDLATNGKTVNTIFGNSDYLPWIRECEILGSNCNPYPSGQNCWQAFWRTLIAGVVWDGTRVSPAAPELADGYRYMRMALELAALRDNSISFGCLLQRKGTMLLDPSCQAMGRQYSASMSVAMEGRNFCSTRKGYFGLVPSDARLDDMICIFSGANVPFVIRPAGGGQYHLIGECYIHGVMDGEAMEKAQLQKEEFSLI